MEVNWFTCLFKGSEYAEPEDSLGNAAKIIDWREWLYISLSVHVWCDLFRKRKLCCLANVAKKVNQEGGLISGTEAIFD